MVLLALAFLAFGLVLVMLRIGAGVRVGKSQLINPTDSPEDAQALGILIVEVQSKPAVLHFPGSQRKVGRVWLEHRTHFESTHFGFGARQVIGPDTLFVMTVETFTPVEEEFVSLPLRINDKRPHLQWSSGLAGFVKVSLRLGGETPSAVTVSTGTDKLRIEIPRPGA
jgi:hypothetical protein